MRTYWRWNGVMRRGLPILLLGMLWGPAASAEEQNPPVVEPEQPVNKLTLTHDETGEGADRQRPDAEVEGEQAGEGAEPPTGEFLSREQISSVIRSHSNDIRICYERDLQEDPTLEGRITVNWIIGLDGRVIEQTAVENTMGSGAVESCILEEISRMRFDVPKGGMVNVTYPFTFRTHP